MASGRRRSAGPWAWFVRRRVDPAWIAHLHWLYWKRITVEATLPSRLGIMQTDSLDDVYVGWWLHGHAFATAAEEPEGR